MFPTKNTHAGMILLFVSCLPNLSTAAMKEGDAGPDLNTFQLEGKLPAKLKGQIILLDFWASWCGPCKASFPAMEDLHKRYGNSGFTIVAVSVDDNRQDMERFVKSTRVSFAVVRDAAQKLVAFADVSAMPTSFIIDRTGKVRFVHRGFNGDDTAKQYQKEIELLLKESAK
jgi:thiol-disulfide isomerase/thioredoxin